MKPPTERMVLFCNQIIHLFIFIFHFSVLSRVQAFLPQLEASNAILAQRAREDPNSIDIEHIPDGIDQYIEMVSFICYYLDVRI